MFKKRGRPKKEIPKEIVQDIIYSYTKDYNVSGKISYMDVYRFSQELYKNEKTPYNIGEFFWRKGEGRDAIDKANQIIKHSSPKPYIEDEMIVNTEEAINKYFDGNKADKQKLIRTLKMNEIKLQKLIQKSNNLEKELFEIKQEVVKAKEQTQNWKNKVGIYEDKMFQWMEMSISKDVPLKNLLSTGKSRNKTVDELLKSILSDNPLEVFDRMKDIMQQKKQEAIIPNTQEKPLSIESYKNKNNSILDDIDL
ncbi:hypothetical protein [Peribacillus frigoritolerans]|uniref:hypothetical protein n=1 Tax=Peribacillus frigoritolerans TaxID=450367 RepID=UPI00207A32D1|nr:hypothetical protein [Peribacillus frigoritolerans]MEE3953436.1 hypothetical protein [Peribacillus frigoritolerans]USK63406.1 hypothetical protein LIT26_19525 [Peribacillus frigoritolerans]